jgi:ring-1,2-phenylacetyl-CoA epoxidase subunit PaaE
MSKFYKLKIANLKKETKDAVSIAFEIPSELKTDFSFIAGQYITLKIIIEGQEVRRAYSICSSPNSQELRVAVKKVKNGTFSVFANEQLQSGDEIEVSFPEGKFILETDTKNNNNYLAFAAGSGITPVMSMVKTVLETEPNSKFILVYGNKSTYETIFFDEINALMNQYNNRFSVQYVYSKEQPENSLFGRIDTSTVNYVLNKFNNGKFEGVFICGPETMINTVKETLLSKGFAEDSIHFELFSASESKKEDENISPTGESKITILLDDEETTFTMNQKSTILDAALKEGLDAPYSCQGGICSSCLAKITSGSAVMENNSILSKEEVESGMVLTCQAHPTTAEITIDYDDV